MTYLLRDKKAEPIRLVNPTLSIATVDKLDEIYSVG